MNKKHFYKKFGPKTIWVVPSKENIQTIKDIWNDIDKQQEEIKKTIKEFTLIYGLFDSETGNLYGYKTGQFCENPTDILINMILNKLK